MKSAPIFKKSPSTKHSVKKEKSFPIVAIGASAGGLEAVSILLKNLPHDTGMAYIYVQHLSPDHKSFLTSILSKITKMKVQEIDDMELMKPDNVYVIPPNKEIKVIDGHIRLVPRPKKSATNLSVDLLFKTLADTHKKYIIGVVLSGYASDGMKGLKAIKDAGGITFAQDDTAQASSMPHSAIATGVVDFVLSPKEIAKKLVQISKNGFPKRIVKIKEKEVEVPEDSNLENVDSNLKTIFELLHKEKGVDFSHYKMPTINRRLKHQMQESGVKTVKEYEKLLLKNNKELDLLYKDLLINVTSFFRDKEAFDYLKTNLLPKILKGKTIGETLRIWVPACSSGQEAYSIAMLVTELQDTQSKKIPVQIFGTDLSEQIIRDARIGEYSQSDVKNISKKYMERFFTKTDDNYQIVKELREMCVFAPHNILRDPPFSRMDFISCRNVLIYFDASAQKRVFATLHYALKVKGYLMLGKAETVGTASQFFTQINNKHKIYSRKKNTEGRRLPELIPHFPKTNFNNKKIILQPKNINANPTGIENAIDSALLSRYTPACAVINKDMEVLQFRGPISLFLSHLSGKASLNILKMARPEFAFELRNAIHNAIKTKHLIIKSGVEIKVDKVLRTMSLEVSPLNIDWDESLLLVVFTLQQHVEKYIGNNKGERNNTTEKDSRIKSLIEELNNARAEMNSIIETHETIHEELQAANEEAVSSNEEFQTLNEELETSKEEIEATNEELISANQNLHTRMDLLAESQEYSGAIIATIHEPMLVLHNDFRVKSANKSFYKKFLVKKEETEGVILFELGKKQWNIPKLRKELINILSKNSSFENFEVTQTFPGIGKKILLLNAHLIIQKTHREQLILLAISDITEVRKLAIELQVKERANEMSIVNKELAFRANELLIANKKLILQNEEKEKQAAELAIANEELLFQTAEKEKRAAELAIADIELNFQNKEKEKLKIINKELEEAKSKAESATHMAEEAVKAKQQFLSNMSHEIRTPMNAIIGFTNVILKTKLDEKQKEYLSAIKISGDTLIVLINDILDLAKVDAGKIVIERMPFKLSTSISSMLHLFETKIQEKNIELVKKFDPAIPEVLIGDSVRLHQIILNLLGNAVKFTNKGKITVSVKMLKEDAEKVTIKFSIKDTGIGIPEDQLATIFDAFHQASNDTSRLYGGTGLGLAIVKKMIAIKGGTIDIKSKVNEGSTFSFVLSFKKTNLNVKIDDGLETEREVGVGEVKVLVVEDLTLNQLLIKTLLEDFGFEMDIVDNGKIAIEKLQKNKYDIILMDLQMPLMNGFEATAYIRNKLNSQIPIIALTADVTTTDVEKCRAVGMNDYISKPIDEKLLYSKIIQNLKKPGYTVVLADEPAYAKASVDKIKKCINLDYLKQLTKNNSSTMAEMIEIYLEETPTLINAMKQAIDNKEWESLRIASHSISPSFSMMGINTEFENSAKIIQENATRLRDEHSGGQLEKELTAELNELFLKIEAVCIQAAEELKKELLALKLK